MTVKELRDFREQEGQDDIEHYGVLGMKWGVRKDPQRAYERANKKLEKLDRRIIKSEKKVEKAQKKSIKKQEKAIKAFFFPKDKSRRAIKSLKKVNKLHLKAQKRMRKAVKWYQSMEDAFRDVKLSDLKTRSEYVELGKKYSEMLVGGTTEKLTTKVSIISKDR